MRKAASKALYLFLCAILGMVLFVMLQRAILFLYNLLIFVDSTYAFGMSSATILGLDFFTLLLALFLGGWYGTMMGIDWYAMIYGPNAEVQAGLFHGFLPHNWRGKKSRKASSKSHQSAPARPTKLSAAMSAVAAAPAAISTTVKVPVQEAVKEAAKVIHREAVREWSFDDLIAPSAPKPAAKKKPAVRKTVAKKTTRKPAVKKAKPEKTE